MASSASESGPSRVTPLDIDAASYVDYGHPGALGRFARVLGWQGPHLLRRIPTSSTSSNENLYIPTNEEGSSTFFAKNFNAGATLDDNYRRASSRLSGQGSTAPLSPPTRPRSSSSSNVAAFLRSSLTPGGKQIYQLLILFVYLIVVIGALLFQSSPFSDGNKSGSIALVQVPVLFALAIKNNPAGWTLGLTYEKVNYMHRFVGRCAILCANIHAAYYLFQWSQNGTIEQQLSIGYVAWGLASLAIFNFMWLCSLEIVRTRAYNLFKTVHIIGAITVLVTIGIHRPGEAALVAIAAGIYAFDTVFRAYKLRLVTGTLTPSGSSTLLTLPLGGGWRAGDHIRVRVLSTKLGALRWIVAHPFSVVTAPDGKAQLELLIQPVGMWTTRLNLLARGKLSDPKSEPVEEGSDSPSSVSVRVLVEGPYGGLGRKQIRDHSGALVVVGGSGISFGLGILHELAHNPGRVRHAQLVWAVQDPSALISQVDRLGMLLSKAEARGVDVHVRVHYTRALTDTELSVFLPRGVSVRAGRPPLQQIMQSAGERVLRTAEQAGGTPTGLWVGACGPTGLCDSVGQAVSGVDLAQRTALRGINFHREMFRL